MPLQNLTFRSRISKERDEYIRDSLSSLAISDRLSSWSRDRDPKTKPFDLKFHKEWRHPDCRVMQWYNLLGPSTQFTSIEHRTTLAAPFFHEFLLIHLTDGSTCRLERMGDGSRTDAVRTVGCAAHDIIQWFHTGEYSKSPISQEPSAPIIHIQLPRPFDLLDVLAICYTMQKHSRTCVYTLQRYNCYFLCLIVLTTLTRYAEEWDKLITSETWPKLTEKLLEDLPRMKHQDATDHFGIGVCSLLELEHPGLIKLVLDSLRRELLANARSIVKSGIANVLWHKNLQLGVRGSFSEAVDAATESILEDDSESAVALNTLLSPGNYELYPDTEFRDPRIQKAMAEQYFATQFKSHRQIFTRAYETYKMRKAEETGHSLRGVRIKSYITGPFVGWRMFSGEAGLRSSVPGMRGNIGMRLKMRFAFAQISASLTRGRYTALAFLDPDYVSYTLERNQELDELVELYETYRLPVVDTRNKALHIIHQWIGQAKWASSLKFALSRLLLEALSDSVGSTKITVLGPEKASWSVLDMQAHIQRRIHEHAKRVDTYGLSAAPLVEGDIEKTMSEVWESLPQGFGRVQAAS